MLLTGRAFTEAGRALAVWTAFQLDVAERHPDPKARANADGLVALLTPVVKAAFTDFGFESAVISQQVFGGHGYVREWGMEQFVRDARITQIYEGTNGIQALDLVTRKLPMESGQLPHRFFSLVREELEASSAAPELVAPVAEALDRLEDVTRLLQGRADDAQESGAAATDYLRMFALVLFGWMWVRLSGASDGNGSAQTRDRKAKIARFFVDRLLPQTLGLESAIRSGSASVTSLDPVEL